MDRNRSLAWTRKATLFKGWNNIEETVDVNGTCLTAA